MRTTTACALATGMAVFFALAIVYGEDTNESRQAGPAVKKSTIPDVGDIAAKDAKARAAAVARLQEYRRSVIIDLMRILEQTKPGEHAGLTPETMKGTPEVSAMLLLGDYRASEAVPALVERIDYRDPRTLVTGRYYTIAESFPAAAALVKIGCPCVTPLVTMLATTDRTKKAHELALWALEEILGKHLAKVRLEDEIERMKDGDEGKRQRLQDALRVISTSKPTEGAGKG